MEIIGKDESKIGKNEELLKVKDALGRLPIHYACKHHHLKEVIETMVAVNLESLKIADIQGFLPIHVACRFSHAVALIKFMLFKAPETVSWKTKKGNTPAMIAMRYMEEGERKRQVLALFQRYEYTDTLLRSKGLRQG